MTCWNMRPGVFVSDALIENRIRTDSDLSLAVEKQHEWVLPKSRFEVDSQGYEGERTSQSAASKDTHSPLGDNPPSLHSLTPATSAKAKGKKKLVDEDTDEEDDEEEEDEEDEELEEDEDEDGDAGNEPGTSQKAAEDDDEDEDEDAEDEDRTGPPWFKPAITSTMSRAERIREVNIAARKKKFYEMGLDDLNSDLQRMNKSLTQPKKAPKKPNTPVAPSTRQLRSHR